MSISDPKIVLLGSNVTIHNLPVKEVSLLAEGSLPAYGYNPGDLIELLAGRVNVEDGRLDQCLTWISSFLTAADLAPQIRTYTYGEPKEIYQFFRKRNGDDDLERQDGWFMTQQILPAEGRSGGGIDLTAEIATSEALRDNVGILVIDDSGHPPQGAAALAAANPGAWVLAMGISVAHWEEWAAEFGERFVLFGRLSDLETTRMEMDSSATWESLTAMAIRALRAPEVGIWDEKKAAFRCQVLIEMYPYGLLYVGPEKVFFRHREKSMPEKSSSRQRGSVPCYDTLIMAMLVRDYLRCSSPGFSRNYFYDLSKQVLLHWNLLNEHGYFFSDGLEFPNLDFTDTLPGGRPCSFFECGIDPCFIELPPFSVEFERLLAAASSQIWDDDKKLALRAFFRDRRLPVGCETTAPAAGYLDVILEVLHLLKEEVSHKTGFNGLRLFQVGNLRTADPAEIDPVLTLQTVMDSYISKESFQRPLCIGVFGPPGAGKSFSVKEVAREIGQKIGDDPFEFFEFNLTQFAGPDEINAAIDLIRATVAKGKVPIAFWDEFDCRYNGNEFGYLRYFLPSMQDGVSYVHGIPHYIGRSIFVFAGGVKSSWAGMEAMLDNGKPQLHQKIKALKIPDFMSRLRVVLDIDGIEIADHLLQNGLEYAEFEELRRILLKRAFIIAHQMDTHWKKAARKTSGLLLRLLLARYKFGARSIEAVIEASRAADRLVYGLPELIGPSAARIHAEWRIEHERELDLIRKAQGLRAVW